MSVMTDVHNLSAFGLADMVACGGAMRRFGQQERSMEAFARRVTQYFQESLVNENGESACALVRFFVTQPAGNLPPLRRALLPKDLPESVQCLTLLGTAGIEREWREPKLSHHHQVMPLLDKQTLGKSPMIFQLIQQCGVNAESVLNPVKNFFLDNSSQEYNIFHIDEAAGNPALPDQEDFVIPYRIKSALGFGGTLPSGTLFAMIFFATIPVSRNTADLFRTVALNLRLAILRFEEGLVFGSDGAADV